MKPYISLNTKYRAETKNNFEKNLYKFLNNSVFGKTIQNDKKGTCDLLLMKKKKQEIDSLLQKALREVNIFEIRKKK